MGPSGGNFWSGNFLFGKCITRRRLAGKPGVGAADSFAQWYLDAKAQFFARSRRAGYVAVRRGSSRCGGSDVDINFRWQSGGDFARERGDVQGFFGADVIGAMGLSVEEDGPEPDHPIGGVQIRTHRGAVSLDANRAIVKTIRDKVANGTRGVEAY